MNKSKTTKILYLISKRVALTAAVFAVIISLLLIVNYLRTKSIDPLNSKAISQLLENLRRSPDDTALKEQVRALDLLARKAYFTYQWQIRSGSILLFVFVLVFLTAVKYLSSLKTRLPNLDESPVPEDTWEHRLLSRRSIIFGGLGLFLLAFILGILSEREMNRFGVELAKDKTAAVDFSTGEEMRKNWPGFRGPEGNGISYHSDIPTEWDGKSNKNISWKIPIPLPGFNSPILWDNKIFLSGADRENQVVYCIAADSGKILWQAELNDIPGSPENRPKPTEDTGYAAPTMTTDGRRVYVIFAAGDIACLDFSGKRLWAKNIGMPENHYGHSSSLITHRDLLLIQFDQNTGGRLIALKTNTGIQVYDKSRDVQISWASPIVVNTGSRFEVILNSNPYVISYDPLTGGELWRVSCMSGEVAPSPAYADGMVFVVNDYARLAAIRLGDKPEVAWEYDEGLSEVASLAATKDFVIMAASYGSLSCLNSKTGERYWIEEFDHGFYSSPILVGDLVYLVDMKGTTLIFKAAKDFKLIAKNELGENSVTIPAFSDGHIFIRGDKHLFCIGNK